MTNNRPVDPRAERICTMFVKLVKEHKDEITEIDLDWSVVTLEREYDGYTSKTQIQVPLVNLKFRQYA